MSNIGGPPALSPMVAPPPLLGSLDTSSEGGVIALAWLSLPLPLAAADTAGGGAV